MTGSVEIERLAVEDPASSTPRQQSVGFFEALLSPNETSSVFHSRSWTEVHVASTEPRAFVARASGLFQASFSLSIQCRASDTIQGIMERLGLDIASTNQHSEIGLSRNWLPLGPVGAAWTTVAERGASHRSLEPSVAAFLDAHQDLLPLIEQAKAQLTRIFGAQHRTTWKIFEDEDGSILHMLIWPNQPVDVAHELLSSFEDEWWLDNISDANGFLNIALRFG